MDPKLAIDATREAFELFRRDFLVASVVVLLAINAAWAWALRGVLQRLAEVQEKRVQDQIAGEKRAEALAAKMAAHMDRATEAAIQLLREADDKRGRRKTPDPASTTKKSTESL